MAGILVASRLGDLPHPKIHPFNGSSMRCLLCEADMILMKVIEDETMLVPGFEHRTYMCSECHDIERRFVFNKSRERDVAAVPIVETTIAPASTVQDQPDADQGILRRVLTRIRGK
jgi:hypothetical protein